MDLDSTRYKIEDKILVSHRETLVTIDDRDIPRIHQHYSEWRRVRRNFDAVNRHLLAYFEAISRFLDLGAESVSPTELRDVLAAERLAFATLKTYGAEIAAAAEAASALNLSEER